jgi:mono/diheme cytochrome c family protein
MLRQIGLLIALGCGGLLAAAGQSVSTKPALHRRRTAASDLEVIGTMPGLPRGESRFVTREFLLALPRVSVHIDRDEDFPAITMPGVMVSGVYLDVLARHLRAPLEKPSAIEAICADGYAAEFPSGYIWIHRPVLVLTVDGLSPQEWSAKRHGYDAGPYFIAYEHFAPHFKVLSHEDRPLEPDQVNKLLFTTKAALYAGIEPKEARDPAKRESPVVSGFRIARQNCFRCHNSGDSGGTQSGMSWKKLEKVARDRPDYFASWVYDPKTLDPESKMPANRNYDKATLDAITKYFSVLGTEGN